MKGFEKLTIANVGSSFTVSLKLHSNTSSIARDMKQGIEWLKPQD